LVHSQFDVLTYRKTEERLLRKRKGMKKDVTRTNVLVKADILWAYPETGQGVLVKRMWDRCRTDEYASSTPKEACGTWVSPEMFNGHRDVDRVEFTRRRMCAEALLYWMPRK
jgi:hypothetical protein